ncbi:endonuclease/exonuclease/phosphatase family protein [Stakelama pacifica]|uniref:Endonuclease/exonuclease/phosphatase family metal-dependent hydrolase n=1 Tax=Stakelama pacifica TaxID=517720 RepID=A0A4R6FEQ4_9SPHN|nr:endonuclease/exonuclease/phosphatase family protein [Stakelama pacifica]TDN78815.1 endonuclease/exonuclease/phosphatase family metal-dependent hydrolase [Stakelama pacifica]GGO99027.1 endonuclease [Stakelama pacifica]
MKFRVLQRVGGARVAAVAVALLAVSAPALAQTSGAADLTVMSFNVRYASDTGEHSWPERRPVAIATIRAAHPDVIGTQELLKRQGDDIVRALPDYRWFGIDRRGGHDDEHMGIFYRPDRLTLLRHGEFWLSDTPDKPGSMSWGVDLPRNVNWAVFETKGADAHRFLFLDTHLAHRDVDAEARQRSAAQIVARLPDMAKGMPLVLAGDMNARPDSEAYATFAEALTDAREAAKVSKGPDNSFHDFTGTADRRIDYIFVRGFDVLSDTTDTFHEGKVYPSDHFPVVAKLRFEAGDDAGM